MSSAPAQGHGGSWLLGAGKQHQVGGVAWSSVLLNVEERNPALPGLAKVLG